MSERLGWHLSADRQRMILYYKGCPVWMEVLVTLRQARYYHDFCLEIEDRITEKLGHRHFTPFPCRDDLTLLPLEEQDHE